MMQALQTFDLTSLLDTFLSIGSAFVLGGAIGLERQFRQRTAGLRTNTLVAVGAAVFVDMAMRLAGHEGAVRVVAYVVSGIGFLGAGVIMKDGAQVSGLNTAATLWGSGAVGACAGADLLAEAIVATVFVLAANTLLRPVVNQINRQPLEERFSEATYTVTVVCERDAQADAREKLVEWLEAANYPIRDIDQEPFGDEDVEMEAVLYATAVDGEELDKVMDRLQALPGVLQAFWSASADD